MSEQKHAEIGPYRIVRTLGSGTTGTVKLAVHKETNEEVAIKIIRKSDFETKPNLQMKIHREISLMKIVSHPHLLRLLDVLESERHLYMILEFASKGELFDYLVSKRFLKEASAMHFFRQLIYGLEYLHSLGICHRDLKPENILLDEQLNIKIADFGFARFAKSNIAETSCGSPHYAAPEVIRGQPYDGRAADIWSCGVILFALLAGYLPFDDPSIRTLLAKVKKGYFEMPAFPPHVRDLISRMLTLDVSERITIPEIKQHECFLRGMPEGYILPKPIPNVTYDPIPMESLSPELIDIFHRIGFTDDDELRNDLETPAYSLAKVFTHLLTNRNDYINLPWDRSVGEEDVHLEQNEIYMDGDNRAYGVVGDELFHRHFLPQTGQSLEMYSLAMTPAWQFMEADVIPTQEEHRISCGVMTSPFVMNAIQQVVKAHGMRWFHPNDVTIVAWAPDVDLYVTALCREGNEQDTTVLAIVRQQGPDDAFAEFCQHAEEQVLAPLAEHAGEPV